VSNKTKPEKNSQLHEQTNGTVGNLNDVKPNERVVTCIWAKFK
jgi:hypothetical protein